MSSPNAQVQKVIELQVLTNELKNSPLPAALLVDKYKKLLIMQSELLTPVLLDFYSGRL